MGARVIFIHKLQSRCIVRVKSVHFDEHLYASDVFADTIQRRRRMALMWMGRDGQQWKERSVTSKRLWEFEPVEGTQYFCIKSVEFNQYLYAVRGNFLDDGTAQARMALMW